MAGVGVGNDGEGIMMELRYLVLMAGAVAGSTLITVWALMWVLQ